MARTTFEVVILSSPPERLGDAPQSASPTSNQRRVATLPSSPLSLSPLLSSPRKSSDTLKSGSRAAPIPANAARGFATAGSLVRSDFFANQLEAEPAMQTTEAQKESFESTGGSQKATKTKRAASTKTADKADSEQPMPKARGRKLKTSKGTGIHKSDPRETMRTTSSHFLQTASEHAIETPHQPAKPPRATTKTGKPRKPRAKKQTVEGSEQTTLKSAKITKPKGVTRARGKAQHKEANIVSAHFREDTDINVASEDGPTELQQGAVHAPHIRTDTIWEVPQRSTFKKMASPKQPPVGVVNDGFELDEAIMRRRDWTPAKDTECATFTEASSVGKENCSSHQQGTGTGHFTSMVSSFTFTHVDAPSNTNTTTKLTTESIATTKRRRVELVEVPGNQTTSRNSSPEKSKAPKKKARTITDLVTGQYAPQESNPETDHSVTSDFFVSRSTITKAPLNVANSGSGILPQKPTRKRSTSKTATRKSDKRGETTTKSKKGSAKTTAKPRLLSEKLLSPASAVLKMNKQDILFGTSSQLALDESPTLVREIQRAMKESELMNDIPNISSDAISMPRMGRLSKFQGKRSLWNASSRDEEGMLLAKQDVYLPEPDRTQDIALLMDGTHDDSDNEKLSNLSLFMKGTYEGKHVPDDDPSLPDPQPLAPALPPLWQSTGVTASVVTGLLSPPEVSTQDYQNNFRRPRNEISYDREFEDIDDYAEAPPSNQNAADSEFLDIDDFKEPSPDRAQADCSPYSLPQTLGVVHQPNTFVTAHGPPKKSRNRLPKKQLDIPSPRLATPAFQKTYITPNESGLSSSRAFPVATSRLTPRKRGRFANVEEILDSEDETLEALSPTPPRFRTSPPLALVPSRTEEPATKEKKKEEVVPVVPVQVFRIKASQLEWNNIKSIIYSQISCHINKLDMSTKPGKISWQEKIKCYDPIVLEEFTPYLNMHTPIRTYRRATQKQIKVWNKKLKGQGKEQMKLDQDDTDHILAVEKELEMYMVQKWCEENSICCISAENRGKSSVRKGFY